MRDHQILRPAPTPYEALDFSAFDWPTLDAQLRARAISVRDAPDAATLAAEVDAWQHEEQVWMNARTWANLRFYQQPGEPERQARRQQFVELAPAYTERNNAIKAALLDHPRCAAWAATHGQQALALWRGELASFDPKIANQLVREEEYNTRYTALLTSARMDVAGSTYSLGTIRPLLESLDRSTRLEATRAQYRWLEAHREELETIFDKLVHLRHDSARALGYDSYTELGYVLMQRIGYGPEQLQVFRDEVRTHVTPHATTLAQAQRAELGLDTLYVWDDALRSAQGNPSLLREDHTWFEAQTQQITDALHPAIGGFHAQLLRGGYADLYEREDKSPGGFCTSFPGPRMPFIYANFNGLMSDARTFFHELGHAFQAYASFEQPLNALVWPTTEACEVHSMGMEYLVHPYLELLFGEDAELYRTTHLAGALRFMPYGCAVDDFQHMIYARPDATPMQRREMWAEMEAAYTPWVRWGELEPLAFGSRWMFQRHIYRYPFYYIDYVLALACALQLWMLARADEAKAMDAYVRLCMRGGEEAFETLMLDAGLRSPLQPGCLDEVIRAVNEAIGAPHVGPGHR